MHAQVITAVVPMFNAARVAPPAAPLRYKSGGTGGTQVSVLVSLAQGEGGASTIHLSTVLRSTIRDCRPHFLLRGHLEASPAQVLSSASTAQPPLDNVSCDEACLWASCGSSTHYRPRCVPSHCLSTPPKWLAGKSWHKVFLYTCRRGG